MNTGTVTAPWSDEQIQALAAWQADPTKHAYTCETSEHGPLTVTRDALVCETAGCGYRQTWALDHVSPPSSPMAEAFAEMAEQLQPFREFAAGERARFLAQGFTDQQAGDLAVEMFRQVMHMARQPSGGQQ